MAQVTVELRTLLDIEDFELFDFDYGINDPVWKEEFENLFKNYYYFYEIGAETADRFKHNLKTRLQTIMPYYNQLYETSLIDIDPIINYRVKELYQEDQHANSQSTSSTTNESTRTDYPQHSNIQQDIPTEKLRNVDSNKINSSGESGRDYEKLVEGLQGNPNELLRQYRENIININHQLIRECKDLFILVY